MNKKQNSLHVVDILVIVLLSVYALSLIGLMAWGILTSSKSYDDFAIFGNIIDILVSVVQHNDSTFVLIVKGSPQCLVNIQDHLATD